MHALPPLQERTFRGPRTIVVNACDVLAPTHRTNKLRSGSARPKALVEKKVNPTDNTASASTMKTNSAPSLGVKVQRFKLLPGRGKPLKLLDTAPRQLRQMSPSRQGWGVGPPKSYAFCKHVPSQTLKPSQIFEADEKPHTQFRRYYERGDLPVCVRHGAKQGVVWKVEPENLDYLHFLPIFLDGLCEQQQPFAFLSFNASVEMIERGGEQVLAAVPSIILPLKKALNTKDSKVLCRVLAVFQALVKSHPFVGESLVPYYRQLLPVLNMFRSRNVNLGDGMEYGQRNRDNLGDMIQETLNLLELYGGEDAFINIKYIIPTYESALPFPVQSSMAPVPKEDKTTVPIVAPHEPGDPSADRV